MKLLTLFAAYMLQVAGVVIAVDIPVFRFSAMVAFAHDYILVRLVDRNGNALIKYITFSVEETALYFRIFPVGDNAALKLGNVFEAFLEHKSSQFLAADAPVQ